MGIRKLWDFDVSNTAVFIGWSATSQEVKMIVVFFGSGGFKSRIKLTHQYRQDSPSGNGISG
ncbi:hypothetical protein CANTEDRAFT_116317 [Yamadazyma tenuis ATCC 10573]|uniref:Uncharacterized protein n=1 Tax=Candida tenuis (strain ATCC 10573 / BCRC 21748 / CBS 615 / JCM 9827 / NBRC 10315 / NRRL Y-1498 / VKM Y-70) TaxID=590646 RepID=G3BD73_CANTC|nr:uncharacterized protein CANTEDRAFT_116317 [Yamadazyma tenuis ATCC 10573]EGV60258.1 hypothetical protein CANTEDRAFT_116317 [Yamadazyma tenuis ATCC 10573]